MTSASTQPAIRKRLAAVQSRVRAACDRAGRDPSAVTLIGISKTFPAAVAAEAIRAGLGDLGENRVQEGVPKVQELAALGLKPTWHLVGHLQTNKARPALQAFDVIHSVDSARLLDVIERVASRTVPVFIEVNVAGEASKEGIAPTELAALLRYSARLSRISILGLMTVAPQVDDPEEVRPVFRELRSLAAANGLAGLSMGMTGDFEVAIEEGATHVRIGRALFGERTA